MAVASLILGILSVCMAVGGVGLVVVPYVGSLLSFGAPLLALVGIVLGGVALSRANRMGDGSGLATAGLIVSATAFLPALLLAMTCGVCNAACSGNTDRLGRPGRGGFMLFDGGVAPAVPTPATAPPPVQAPQAPGSTLPGAGSSGDAAGGSTPPPAFPPPPIERPAAEPDSARASGPTDAPMNP